LKKTKVKDTKRVTSIVLIVVAAVLAVSVTLAWFYSDFGGMIYNAFNISNFDTAADIYFEKDGERTEISDISNGIELSMNENDGNYIGNLRVDALYKGKGYGYLRVRMIHSVTYTGEDGKTHVSQFEGQVPYGLSTEVDWFDNRKDDYCVYLKNRINATSNEDWEKYPLITDGFFADNLDMTPFENPTNANLKLIVEVDAVQINRYMQYWDIEKLPWE